MANQRQVEVFSAGCPVCDDAVRLVERLACPSCAVSLRDMGEPDVAARAAALGIRSLPAVVIDGVLADCCRSGGLDEAALKAAGIGTPLP